MAPQLYELPHETRRWREFFDVAEVGKNQFVRYDQVGETKIIPLSKLESALPISLMGEEHVGYRLWEVVRSRIKVGNSTMTTRKTVHNTTRASLKSPSAEVEVQFYTVELINEGEYNAALHEARLKELEAELEELRAPPPSIKKLLDVEYTV